EEMRLFRDVTRAEQQQAISGQTVATSATGFLIIAFDVFRQIVMNDPANVGFVDAHAEGDRRANDPRVVAEKLFLIRGAFVGSEAGVIRARGKTAARERFGDALGGGATGAVNDSALVFALADEIDDLLRGLIFR